MSNEINVGAISEALNNKVDLNQLNTNAQGLEYVSGLSMPSSRYIDLTLGASGSTYTAPANGYYCASFQMPAGTNSWYFNLDIYRNGEILYIIGENGNALWSINALCPVLKGDVIKTSYVSVVANAGIFRFIYAEGAE